MTPLAGAPGTAGAHFRGIVHDSDLDVTDARTPTAEQARAIDLLELNPDGRAAVRLSLADWKRVDQVALKLGRCRCDLR